MATGFAIAGLVTSAVGSRKASKAQSAQSAEQAAIDAENVERERIETEESIARTEIEHGKTEAQARMEVAASGFAVGSSLDKYVATMQEEHTSDVDWMRTSGASRAAIQERESAARYRSGMDRSSATKVAGIGSAFVGIAKLW